MVIQDKPSQIIEECNAKEPGRNGLLYLTIFHVQISTAKEINPAEKHMYFITVPSVTSVSITTATKRA